MSEAKEANEKTRQEVSNASNEVKAALKKYDVDYCIIAYKRIVGGIALSTKTHGQPIQLYPFIAKAAQEQLDKI